MTTMEKEVDNLEVDAEQENYVPPAQKSVSEIIAADAEDESLNRYKQQLLGEAKLGQVIVDASDPRNVLVKSITLVVDGRPDITMQLDKDHLNDAVFTIKEGAAYRIRFDFHVQREICTGLKYKQKVTRHSITVDRDTFMVGSYAPKMELQSYTTPLDEAPSGVLHRGSYKVKSQVTDDDGNDWLTWTWTLEISKDW
uniref:Rho GDP-dissociation inhibitor 3 n=1 Tax=Parascaris univalens TaxID=6257 RepID=A0A915CA99_PARUN